MGDDGKQVSWLAVWSPSPRLPGSKTDPVAS